MLNVQSRPPNESLYAHMCGHYPIHVPDAQYIAHKHDMPQLFTNNLN